MADLRETASEAGEWQELLDQQLEDNTELRDQLEELQGDLDDLRVALAEAQAQTTEDEEEDDLPDVASVEDAVRLASKEPSNVVFLPSAYAAARESKYPYPRQVLRDLQALGRVSKRWAAGELTGGFKAGFDTEPVTYRERISQTAATKYKSDYEVDYAGSTVMMGPHLRRGVGSPEAILRIYWYVDHTAKQLVVGHVGRKLRDKKNA
jgi:TolA-binding protein